ncbi:hypothetical protein HY483_01575 [Candidatus Woesearchaeota archaeon]|nr:hypothetical protein [Candidatus Woesearchaeota archaeon]
MTEVMKKVLKSAVEVNIMAKKGGKGLSGANWFGWLILLLGLWFVLGSLSLLPTWDWDLLSLLTLIWGVKLVARGSGW